MSESQSRSDSSRTALRVGAAALMVVVVLPFVVTGIPAVVGAEESFVVLSGSMAAEPEPVIHPGDVVIVNSVDPSSIQQGDIVTFRAGGSKPVTHRVTQVQEQEGTLVFRTMGDANEDPDPQLVRADQLVGRVAFVIPWIGHVVNFVNTTQGFVLLVLLPIGLLILSEAWNVATAAGDSNDEDRRPPDNPSGYRAEKVTAATRTDHENEGEEEENPTVTLRRTHLKWAMAALAPLSAATGYGAYRLQTAWAITAFYALMGTFLLCGFIYLRLSSEDEDTESRSGTGGAGAHPPHGATSSPSVGSAERTHATERRVERPTSPGEPVVTGHIETDIDETSHVEVVVESRSELVDMAVQKGRWVVYDPEAETHFLVDDGVVFRCADSEREQGAAATDTAASGPASGIAAASPSEAVGPESDSEGETTTTETYDAVETTDSATDSTPPESTPDERRPAEDVTLTTGVPPTETIDDEEDTIPEGSDTAESEGSTDSAGTATRAGATTTDEAAQRNAPEIDTDGTPSKPEQNAGTIAGSELQNRQAALSSSTESSRSPDPDNRDTAENQEPSAEPEQETGDLPSIVRAVDRAVNIPLRALGFLGYIVVEPVIAAHGVFRGNGETPEIDGGEKREP